MSKNRRGQKSELSQFYHLLKLLISSHKASPLKNVKNNCFLNTNFRPSYSNLNSKILPKKTLFD
jgi:hypothetical protein